MQLAAQTNHNCRYPTETAGTALLTARDWLRNASADTRDWSTRQRKKEEDPGERRGSIRFEMGLPVWYRLGTRTGHAEVRNISSSGALMDCDCLLPENANVELWIKWPALLGQSVQLSLIVVGTVVRADGEKAAVVFDKYEFRTCGPGVFATKGAA